MTLLLLARRTAVEGVAEDGQGLGVLGPILVGRSLVLRHSVPWKAMPLPLPPLLGLLPVVALR